MRGSKSLTAGGWRQLASDWTRPLRWACLASLMGLAGGVAQAQDAAAEAAEVDRQLAEEIGWREADLAPRSDDEVFLRRVFLDTVGVPPAPQELLAFLLDGDPGKRSRVVAQLLDDPRYGVNWSRYWRDVVMYRQSEQRAGLAVPALTRYLEEQLNGNSPWNEIAASFITAEGDVREQGAAGLIMAQGGRPEETVSELSRVFLGIQIQCAQCHDHPTDRWRREQFHELAAFLPRVAIRPVREEQRVRSYEVYATDLPLFRRPRNANNRFRGTPEHRMTDLEHPEEPGKVMQPVFFATGDKLSLGVDDQDRREALAAWMTSPNNPWFARAIVNRLWCELVGEGFYDAIDDIGPDREAKAPETLELLAARFVEQGCDVKHLLEVIMNTSAYQRASRDRRPPGEGVPFAANVAQRLRSDQLFDSLLAVLEIKFRQAPARGYGMMRRRGSPRVAFQQAFGFDPSEPREEVKGSIPQSLFLMNSPLIARATEAGRGSAGRGSMLGRMLEDYPQDRDLVAAMYLKVLSRRPRASELQTSLAHVDDATSRDEAFGDLLWALINSTDFRFRR